MLTILIYQKMQTKMTFRFPLTLIRMVKIEKTKGGSVVKSTGYSSREPGHNSQQLQGSLQLSNSISRESDTLI